MAYNVPNFLMGQAGQIDFSPIQNALAQYQRGQQFNAQNALARDQLAISQGQLSLQQQAAQRAEQEAQRLAQQRAEVGQWAGQGIPGVPQPLADITRITQNPESVKDFLIAEAKRKAEGQFGKQGAAYYDPGTGRSYTIQFGANGERKILPVEAEGIALNPDKGVKTVDTGTGTRIVDASRGRDVREIAKDIEGRETQEKIGQARGQAIADLPRKQLDAQRTLAVIDKLVAPDGTAHPGLRGNFGVSGQFPNLPGGKAADAASLVEQIKSRAFLEAFNSIRGGGAITEAEGQKATTALIRAQNAQSYEAFLESIADFKYQVQTGMELARRQAGVGGPNGNVGMDAGGKSFQLPPGYSIQKVK